jgi:hypothetical protein
VEVAGRQTDRYASSLPFCKCFAFNKSLTFWRQTVREMTDRDRTHHYQTPLTLQHTSEVPLFIRNARKFPSKICITTWFYSLLIEVHICSNYFRLNPPRPFHSVAVVAVDNCFVRMCFVPANSFTCCSAF